MTVTTAAAQTSSVQGDVIQLDSAQIENIVQRSYQYVAVCNIANQTAFAPAASPMGTGGFNQLKRNTRLLDASIKIMAWPSHDSLYQIARFDLRDEPVVLEVPAFDSKYASMMASA